MNDPQDYNDGSDESLDSENDSQVQGANQKKKTEKAKWTPDEVSPVLRYLAMCTHKIYDYCFDNIYSG